jgi:steroid delta-isomerase-like uncharacterized protein
MSKENKAVLRRQLEEVWNKHNLDAIDEFYAPDYVNHDAPPGFPGDRDGLRTLIGMYLSAFPDLKVTNEDEFADGDTVITRWTATGTHTGQFGEIPATGKRIQTHGISISRIAGGKIRDSWSESDQMDMMQQLGVMPPPGE